MTLQAPQRPSSVVATNRGDSASPPSRSRLFTVGMLIVSLLATGLLQNVSAVRRHELVRNTGSTATLSNLNSFSLALLLGGLRGPLVMLLWTTSENQKHDKDLEDFDTKIELIRLLQPEFDSVHIFQIWNKAYNISVQMANLPNKYATILDAVDYARDIDRSHPNDINTLASFGQLFFDKLGNSAEKFYYESRVRKETMWREPDRIREGDPGWRRTKLDPMLDTAGNILPTLLAETMPRPADLPSNAEWNTGAELQYLKRYDPWPYGIPPMALGYNYFKRAQVLKDVSHQKHLQLSDLVVDNRPAIALKLWQEMEANDALWAELRAFGVPPAARPIDRTEMSLKTAGLAPTTRPVDPAAATEAIYHYDLIVKIAADAEAEYRRHLAKYLVNVENFRSHLDTILGLKLLAEGDRDYLRAMTGPVDQRDAMLAKARPEYEAADKQYKVIILRHHLLDAVRDRVYPPNFDRNRLGELSSQQIDAIYNEAQRLSGSKASEDYKRSERHEYEVYIARCAERLAKISK